MLKFWFCFTLLAEIEELNRMNSSSEVFGGIIRQVIVAQITRMAQMGGRRAQNLKKIKFENLRDLKVLEMKECLLRGRNPTKSIQI